MSAPNREVILDKIERHLNSAKHWGSGDYMSAAMQELQARSLIELLESHDCGSIGGFDKEDPKCGRHGDDLASRFKWLKKKSKLKNNT